MTVSPGRTRADSIQARVKAAVRAVSVALTSTSTRRTGIRSSGLPKRSAIGAATSAAACCSDPEAPEAKTSSSASVRPPATPSRASSRVVCGPDRRSSCDSTDIRPEKAISGVSRSWSTSSRR